MTTRSQSLLDTRRAQMFPTLDAAAIGRLRRFGHLRAYAPGEPLVRVGDAGHGLTIILAGNVDVSQHEESGARTPITTHQPGAFMGELAQLSGKPALVDAYARDEVQALVIPP